MTQTIRTCQTDNCDNQPPNENMVVCSECARTAAVKALATAGNGIYTLIDEALTESGPLFDSGRLSESDADRIKAELNAVLDGVKEIRDIVSDGVNLVSETDPASSR